jgi:FkbM family methyltransferase
MYYGAAQTVTTGEIHAIRYIKQRLSGTGRPVIFDIGANRGDYVAALNEVFGSESEIHAFEPLASTFHQLVERFGSGDNISCQNFGFGDNECEVPLHYDKAGSTIASIYPQRDDHPWRTDSTQYVKIRTLDNFIEEQRMEKIAFIKLDIEGHEFQALLGASNSITRNSIQFIQFEFGPRHIDSRTFFRDFFYLLSPRYNIFRVVADGLFPILSYSEFCEQFCAPINYLAELRTSGGNA